MEQDPPRRGPRSAKASAGRTLRRERASERKGERRRFPPLRITGAPSADERHVVVVPRRRHRRHTRPSEPSRPAAASWASKAPGPNPPPQLSANLLPIYPAPSARTLPSVPQLKRLPGARPLRAFKLALSRLPAPRPILPWPLSPATLAHAPARRTPPTRIPPSWRDVFGPEPWPTASSGKRLRPPTWTACELKRNSGRNKPAPRSPSLTSHGPRSLARPPPAFGATGTWTEP